MDPNFAVTTYKQQYKVDNVKLVGHTIPALFFCNMDMFWKTSQTDREILRELPLPHFKYLNGTFLAPDTDVFVSACFT